MLLFKLPWMCHGVRLSLKDKPANASQADELSSQQSFSLRSGSDVGVTAQLRAVTDSGKSRKGA